MIIQDGLRRMLRRAGGRLLLPDGDERELPAPADAGGREEGILRGMYLLREAPTGDGPRVQLLGSGTILREVDRRPPTCSPTTSA